MGSLARKIRRENERKISKLMKKQSVGYVIVELNKTTGKSRVVARNRPTIDDWKYFVEIMNVDRPTV